MCGTQGPGAGPKGPGAGPTRARRWLHKGPALAPQGPGAGPTRSAGAAWGELLRGGGVVTPAHFCPEQVLDEFPGVHVFQVAFCKSSYPHPTGNRLPGVTSKTNGFWQRNMPRVCWRLDAPGLSAPHPFHNFAHPGCIFVSTAAAGLVTSLAS
eukprot:gene12058-biopygen12456